MDHDAKRLVYCLAGFSTFTDQYIRSMLGFMASHVLGQSTPAWSPSTLTSCLSLYMPPSFLHQRSPSRSSLLSSYPHKTEISRACIHQYSSRTTMWSLSMPTPFGNSDLFPSHHNPPWTPYSIISQTQRQFCQPLSPMRIYMSTTHHAMLASPSG